MDDGKQGDVVEAPMSAQDAQELAMTVAMQRFMDDQLGRAGEAVDDALANDAMLSQHFLSLASAGGPPARQQALHEQPGQCREMRTDSTAAGEWKVQPPKEIEYRMDVFMEQLLVHIFFPLSLVYILPVFGYKRARNQSLLPPSLRPGPLLLQYFVFTGLAYVLPWAVLIGQLTRGGAYMADVDALSLLFLVHKLVVATKYAYADAQSLDVVYSGNDYAQAALVGQRLQLLSGWLNPSVETVFVELQAAAERLGHDLAAARLYFSPRRREQMERLVREAFERPEQIRVSGFTMCKNAVSVGLVAAALAIKITKEKQRKILLLGNLLLLIYIGVLSLGMRGLQMGRARFFADPSLCTHEDARADPVPDRCQGSGWGIFMTLAPVPAQAMYIMVVFSFMALGKVDFLRRRRLIADVGLLIADSVEQDEAGLPVVMPSLVDITVPANTVSWVLLRNLAQDFGLRYQLRIAVYTSYALLAFLAMLVWIVITAASGGRLLMEASDLTPGSSLQALLVLLFFWLIIIGLLLSTIMQGAKANDLLPVHAGCLARHKMHIQQLQYDHEKLRRGDLAVHKRLEACVQLLEVAQQSLEVRDKLSPITVMGLRADTMLLRTLITLTVTGLSIILRVMTR